MASFEFAYEICEYADYLVAGETIATAEIEGDYYVGNWRYDEIYRGLYDHPYWNPEEFAAYHLECTHEERDGITE